MYSLVHNVKKVQTRLSQPSFFAKIAVYTAAVMMPSVSVAISLSAV